MATQKAIPGFGLEDVSQCRVCHRALTNPVSIALGIGPVCRGSRALPHEEEIHDMPDPRTAFADIPPAITLHRDEDGTARASIPKRHRHHDTTDGIEWGYHGSGPADLALNILALFMPFNPDGSPGVKLWDGTFVSNDAWACHQHFKAEIIAAVPFDGGTLRRDLIERWIARRDRMEDP